MSKVKALQVVTSAYPEEERDMLWHLIRDHTDYLPGQLIDSQGPDERALLDQVTKALKLIADDSEYRQKERMSDALCSSGTDEPEGGGGRLGEGERGMSYHIRTINALNARIGASTGEERMQNGKAADRPESRYAEQFRHAVSQMVEVARQDPSGALWPILADAIVSRIADTFRRATHAEARRLADEMLEEGARYDPLRRL